MVNEIRLWLIRVLRACLVALGDVPAPVPLLTPIAGAPPVPTGSPDVRLALAAAEWVGKLAAAEMTGVSKRQIAFRALRGAFPWAKGWELNLAIEEATRDVKVGAQEVRRG